MAHGTLQRGCDCGVVMKSLHRKYDRESAPMLYGYVSVRLGAEDSSRYGRRSHRTVYQLLVNIKLGSFCGVDYVCPNYQDDIEHVSKELTG